MKDKRWELFVLLTLVFYLLKPALAAGPMAYLTETVEARYNYTGSLIGTLNRTGYVEVTVPNEDDVLQYIRINLSDAIDETDLNSNMSYRSVAASVSGARTTIYVNDSSDGDNTNDDTSYNITNATAAPALVLNISYSNKAGGYDVHSEDDINEVANTFDITINVTNPSSDKDLGDNAVRLNISFLNTTDQDHLNITTAPGASGNNFATDTLFSNDTDGDGDNETVIWIGNLSADGYVEIDFDAEIQGAVHYSGTSNNLNGLDGGTSDGARSVWNTTSSVLTSVDYDNLFTRGPVLQGIDFTQNTTAPNNWLVRGFIQNVANSTVTASDRLSYNVSNWTIYEVNNSSGAPYSDYNLTFTGTPPWRGSLSPTDNRAYTEWFDSGQTGKPYFTVAFDWEVNWDSSAPQNYYGEINTTLVFPTLYEIDITSSKAITGIILPDDNQTISISDTVTHSGHASAPVYFIELISEVPFEEDTGTNDRIMNINESSVQLFYTNGTGTYELNTTNKSGALNITVIDPVSSTNGTVNVTIYDISLVNLTDANGGLVIGDYLRATEYLELRFDVVTNNTTVAGEQFTFAGDVNFTTLTETPIEENLDTEQITASEKRLVALKQIWAADPNNPTTLNVTINISATDKEGSGIAGIAWIDYVPAGTDFDVANVTLSYYNASDSGGTWYSWTNGQEYNITDNGTITLSDNLNVTGYAYSDNGTEGTWDGTMYDGDIINVSYQMIITTEGDYVLPMQLAGFDPVTGNAVGASAFGYIRVTLAPEKEPLVITEGELELSKFVTVGKPASWTKTFEVFNPNLGPVKALFETSVFKDSLNYFVTYINDLGEEVVEVADFYEGSLVWESVIAPQESRIYTVRVLTPPIVETGRDVEVLEKISDSLIRLKVIVSLRNLAEESYENVRFNLPIKSSQVFSAVDEKGNPLETLGESLLILIPYFPAKSLKEVSVDFKETYPLLIIKTDKDSYGLDEDVVMTITVINGAEDVEHPFVETEVYAEDMELVHSNILDLRSLEAAETAELLDEFRLSGFMPTGAYVAGARFRGGIGSVITSGRTGFSVAGLEPIVPRELTLIVIILLGGLLIYYLVRRERLKK